MSGRVFQVTPAGEIVWEYVSPYFGKPDRERNSRSNTIYRAQPVPYEWAPEGSPRSEKAVRAPDPADYRVGGG